MPWLAPVTIATWSFSPRFISPLTRLFSSPRRS
jgi:hypothetical protein